MQTAGVGRVLYIGDRHIDILRIARLAPDNGAEIARRLRRGLVMPDQRAALVGIHRPYRARLLRRHHHVFSVWQMTQDRRAAEIGIWSVFGGTGEVGVACLVAAGHENILFAELAAPA